MLFRREEHGNKNQKSPLHFPLLSKNLKKDPSDSTLALLISFSSGEAAQGFRMGVGCVCSKTRKQFPKMGEEAGKISQDQCSEINIVCIPHEENLFIFCPFTA